MEYYNKMACITVEELTSGNKPVMSFSSYKKHYKSLNIVRKPAPGQCVLIEYNSLAERFRLRFEAKYGDPSELIKENCMSDRLILSKEARAFYEDYRLANGKSLPIEKIEEYTLNASVLDELIRMLNDRAALRKALGGSTRRLWETVIGTAENFRKNPGHTLPENPARLRDKLNIYKREGFECLISRKFCNENTLKITEEAGNQIIALKRSRVPVYTNEQIFREYNRIARLKGWKPLKSVKSLVQFLSRPEIEPLWYDAVYGELAAKQKYSRKHKTELPAVRDALWYSDGTKLNLYYKDFDENGRLVVRTTQVYEVMDAFSEVLLGYHISDSEDFEAQYNAFRMAVNKAKCRPFEIVNDNQGGHKKLENSGFLKRICRLSRRTAPYNGSSKTIESVFGRFQAQILHKDWRFTGQNITTKTDKSRPNLEFIEANKENLFTLEELKKHYAEARNEWNMSAHPATGISRLEMYDKSVNPETAPVDVLDMIDMFWMTTKEPSTFTASGIKITVKKKSYTYEVFTSPGKPDMNFRQQYTGQKFYVMYDPCDMTVVRLYIKDASGVRFVASAEPYLTIHRAVQEQTEGEAKFLREMDEIIKNERIERQINAKEFEYKYGVAPEQHGLNRPKLKGISAQKVENRPKKRKIEPVNIGEYEKMVSNITPDKKLLYSKL